MIQNHRPYQLVLSKTGCRVPAAAAGVCARLYGAAAFTFCRLFGSRDAVSISPEAARAGLEALCPKPEPDLCWPALPPADPSVDLSVIIPSRNAEKTIDGCIRSILQQDTHYTLQLIVADGDSTDRTLELLQAYPEVKVLSLKGPGSAASARNAALLHATGRYLLFVDSDDQLLPGAVQVLLDTAEQQHADIVQGGWQYLYEDGCRGPVQNYAAMQYTGKRRSDRFDLPGMPWGKVYRRELFERVRFPSHYRCFEDSIIHFLVFRQAKTIVSVPQTVCLWLKNSSGITSTNQHRPSAVQSYWIMEELLAQNDALGLPHDDLFCISLTLQLSVFCYATVSRMDESVRRCLFALCCDLYGRNVSPEQIRHLPYPVRCGAAALESRRFSLWCRFGQLFQLF